MKKLLIVGLGELGGQVYQLLLNSGTPLRIVTADIDEDSGVRKTNLMKYVAGQMKLDHTVEFRKIDLYNVEETAGIIKEVNPDIIYTAATLQSWWVITTLPQDVFRKLDEARFGPWLPMHLTLLYKLMQAVKESGTKPVVINSSFPDATHNVLSKVDLSPHMGIGNVHNVVQPLRNSAADFAGVPVQSVTVFLYLAHYVSHYIPRFGTAGGSPYIMKILIDGQFREDLNHEKIFSELPKGKRRSGGLTGQILTASSAAAIVRAVATDSQELLHSPGVDGLPGGYAARIGEKGARVVLADKVTMDDAIKANQDGNRYDGIEEIRDDGTVVYTDREMAIMKDMIGYECKKMSLEESEERSKEIQAKFKAFADTFQK
jgi:hypothetical protein